MDPKDQDTKASGESQPEQGGAANPMMMGMGMMKKMMSKMGQGGEGPMAMMQKMMGQMGSQKEGEAGNSMQNMMGMCMGMHSEMLAAVHKTASMAAFATPELHMLFGEWMESLEREALTAMADKGQMDVATLAAALKISEESAIHLVSHLASKGKAVLSVGASGDKDELKGQREAAAPSAPAAAPAEDAAPASTSAEGAAAPTAAPAAKPAKK